MKTVVVKMLAMCYSLFMVTVLARADTSQDNIKSAEHLAAEQQFENQVRPLLAKKCWKCQGAEKQKGGLRLDSRAAILRGDATAEDRVYWDFQPVRRLPPPATRIPTPQPLDAFVLAKLDEAGLRWRPHAGLMKIQWY